jgi:hypothetical protein
VCSAHLNISIRRKARHPFKYLVIEIVRQSMIFLGEQQQ